MNETPVFQRVLNLLSFAGSLPFKWGQVVAEDMRLSKEATPQGKPQINWFGLGIVIVVLYLLILGFINLFTKLKNLKK